MMNMHPNDALVHIDFVAIERFRASLPDHRLVWFDALRIEDQARLADDRAMNLDRYEDAETAGGPGA